MKKRLLASGILLLILFPILGFTAHAEEIRPYPYRQFAEGDAYTKSYVSQESDMLNAVKEDLLLSSVMCFEGYVKGEGKFIEQKAETTLPLPAGFKETYHFYQNVFYIGSQHEEGHCRIRVRVANDASSSFESDVDELKKQMELEQKGESWDLFSWRTSDHNQIEDPYQVTEEPDGSTLLVLHLKEEYTNDDGAYGYNEIIWKARVFRIEGLPNLHFIASCKTQFSIGTGRFLGDYDPAKHAETYKAMLELHNKEKADFLALRIDDYITTAENYQIKWQAPNILQEFDYLDVTQRAEENPGEDGGVSVPAAIVVGVLGGGAAIAGAAAASGGADGKKKKRKSYKMYVQKDFGDAIRRGGDKPVIIRARMAEVDESGAERDRNDLTANIGVSTDGMTVHGAALAGRYCEATVSVPENNPNDTANITFTFNGEGGTFTNTVIFRLVDGPSLKFVDERDGTLYHESCGIDAIPGDGFTYTERFAIVDAPTAPKLSDITAVNTGEFDVEFALTDQPAVYRMTVKNNTAPDPEHDVFAKPQDKNFEIHVNVEGEKEPVKGYVTVKLYPEGITVSSTMEGKKKDIKYVRVQAYEKDHVGDLDRKWQVSEIKFTLAVKGEDKAVIDPKEAEYRFEKLKGSGGLGMRADKEQCLAEKYEYKESWGDLNGKFTYTFEPQDMLWEPDNGTFFMVLLPVTCEYDGQTYKDEIPLRLRGKDPDPMEEWNKEYAKTRERIEKFSLPSQKDYNLQQLEKIAANEPRISTWELRLMAKDVVRAYMKYWTEQNEKDKWNAAALDWTVWGLEWVKWIGDCAFSYVVAAYTGPMEAIISPAKDVLVSALGEVGVNIVWGTKFNVENLEVVAALKNAGDNFVSGWASEGAANVLKANPTNIKMAAGIMGAYFAYACLNNYLEHLAKTGESDFYGAIMGAFKDLTVTAIKAAASILFGKWLESENFKNKIGPKLSAFMKKNFSEKCKINLSDQTLSYRIEANTGGAKRWMDIDAEIIKSGIVEKYFTELCGAGAAFIHDNIETAEKALFWFNPAGEIIFSFSINLLAGNVDDESAESVMHLCNINLSKALKNTSGELFNWMYELFFSSLPVATDVMEIPKDPPLPPAKD